ncbi:MAG: hypothetical protein ACRCS8_06470 [Brevinema sp.]
MRFFKILGLFLALSPVTFYNEKYFLPYSFFGIIMYILALIFDEENFSFQKILFCFYGIMSIYYLFIISPILYNLTLIIILLSYFYFKGFPADKRNVITLIGVILTIYGIMFPLGVILAFLCAVIIEIFSPKPLSQELHPIIEELPILIEKIEEESEETEYVIPFE